MTRYVLSAGKAEDTASITFVGPSGAVLTVTRMTGHYVHIQIVAADTTGTDFVLSEEDLPRLLSHLGVKWT